MTTAPDPQSSPFAATVTDEAELLALLGEPSEVVRRKQLPRLDRHCRAIIARSPLVLLGTADAAGGCDVSPRGDAPGSVLVLDDATLAIPERPGNRRADSLRNIVQTGAVGLLFLVPGVEEVLRVNGRGWVVRDPALLERMEARGKRPLLAIGVEVRECYLHCAKAMIRSRLWQPESWPERAALPSLAEMQAEQVAIPGLTVEELERRIEESYTQRLY